jgi:hypothetical protein
MYFDVSFDRNQFTNIYLASKTEMREELLATKEIFTKMLKQRSSKSKVKGYVLVKKDASRV